MKVNRRFSEITCPRPHSCLWGNTGDSDPEHFLLMLLQYCLKRERQDPQCLLAPETAILPPPTSALGRCCWSSLAVGTDVGRWAAMAHQPQEYP